jgi:hypothetical protein
VFDYRRFRRSRNVDRRGRLTLILNRCAQAREEWHRRISIEELDGAAQKARPANKRGCAS